MEKETNKEAEDFMKDIRRKALENQTSLLFHKTTKGCIVELIVILSGIGGTFLYHNLGLNIVFSIILGFITYLIVGAIFDTIVGKLFRIDKQIEWLKNTPEGRDFVEKSGYKSEDINIIGDDNSHKEVEITENQRENEVTNENLLINTSLIIAISLICYAIYYSGK